MIYQNTLIMITIELIGQVGRQVPQTPKVNVSMLTTVKITTENKPRKVGGMELLCRSKGFL